MDSSQEKRRSSLSAHMLSQQLGRLGVKEVEVKGGSELGDSEEWKEDGEEDNYNYKDGDVDSFGEKVSTYMTHGGVRDLCVWLRTARICMLWSLKSIPPSNPKLITTRHTTHDTRHTTKRLKVLPLRTKVFLINREPNAEQADSPKQ